MSSAPYRLERCEPGDEALERYDDRVVFQTRAWLDFVARTQRAEVVAATLYDHEDRPVGRFTGLVVTRMGLRLLGSPLPGWTTSYLGFNLSPGVSRVAALTALRRFAFRELGCVHVEIVDRHAGPEDLRAAGYLVEGQDPTGFEIDLSGGPDAVFANMSSNRRRNVRKAEKNGVTVDEGADGFVEDYVAQLHDVFAKQGLAPTYDAGRVRALVEHLQPTGRLLVLRARDADGRALATGIFPADHRTMYFWGGASWRDAQHLRPNEAIHWHAMRYWMERGVERYDMVGRGEYKKRYGAYGIYVPRGRISKYPGLGALREARRLAHEASQRLRGRLGR